MVEDQALRSEVRQRGHLGWAGTGAGSWGRTDSRYTALTVEIFETEEICRAGYEESEGMIASFRNDQDKCVQADKVRAKIGKISIP